MIPLGVCRFEVLAPGPAKHMRVLYIASWIKAVKHKKRSGTFDDDFTDTDSLNIVLDGNETNEHPPDSILVMDMGRVQHLEGPSILVKYHQRNIVIVVAARICLTLYVLGLFWWLLHHYLHKFTVYILLKAIIVGTPHDVYIIMGSAKNDHPVTANWGNKTPLSLPCAIRKHSHSSFGSNLSFRAGVEVGTISQKKTPWWNICGALSNSCLLTEKKQRLIADTLAACNFLFFQFQFDMSWMVRKGLGKHDPCQQVEVFFFDTC